MPQEDTPRPDKGATPTEQAAYWRARCDVKTGDIHALGIVPGEWIHDWMKANGWTSGGLIGSWELGFLHKPTRSRFTAHPRKHGLLVLLAANTYDPPRCPQDALDSMAEFFGGLGDGEASS